jgi:hypothetical protein
MSILQETQDHETTSRLSSETLAPPYRRGDRICATTPEGTRYLVRIEAIKALPSGQFSIIGAVTEPRKLRSHVLSTIVGADGYGPAVLRSA